MSKLKTILKSTLAITAAVILAFNLSNSKGIAGKNSNQLKLENISILQASAGEYACSHTTPNCCSYTGMYSDGVLSYTY